MHHPPVDLCQCEPLEVGKFFRLLTTEVRKLMSLSDLTMPRNIDREQKVYLIVGIVLLLFLLPISIFGFVSTTLVAEIASVAKAVCASEPLGCADPVLAGQPQPKTESPTPPAAGQAEAPTPPAAGQAQSPTPAAAGQAQSPTRFSDDQLRNKQNVNYAGWVIYSDNRLLNKLILPHPFADEDLGQAIKCKDKTHEAMRVGGDAAWRKCRDDDIIRWETFEGNIYFARMLKNRSDLFYGVLGTYVLPPLYAVLGACVFG